MDQRENRIIEKTRKHLNWIRKILHSETCWIKISHIHRETSTLKCLCLKINTKSTAMPPRHARSHLEISIRSRTMQHPQKIRKGTESLPHCAVTPTDKPCSNCTKDIKSGQLLLIGQSVRTELARERMSSRKPQRISSGLTTTLSV